MPEEQCEEGQKRHSPRFRTGGLFLEGGQGFSRTVLRTEPGCPQKAEAAGADPQLGNQVRPMFWLNCRGPGSISRSWRMLTVPLGGGRGGRDVVEMPVALPEAERAQGCMERPPGRKSR